MVSWDLIVTSVLFRNHSKNMYVEWHWGMILRGLAVAHNCRNFVTPDSQVFLKLWKDLPLFHSVHLLKTIFTKTFTWRPTFCNCYPVVRGSDAGSCIASSCSRNLRAVRSPIARLSAYETTILDSLYLTLTGTCWRHRRLVYSGYLPLVILFQRSSERTVIVASRLAWASRSGGPGSYALACLFGTHIQGISRPSDCQTSLDCLGLCASNASSHAWA